MKFTLLAAAAVFAAPLMAQTADQSTAPTDQTTTTPDQAQGGTSGGAPAGQTAPMDPSTQQPQQQPMGGQTGGTSGGMATGDASASDPAGGYQPSAPPMQGAAQAGQQVTFQQAPSPDQAFPAPAPLAKYPVCKKGQYDNCIQRGGR